MSDLKLLVWNMEWMNDLFGPNDQPAAFRPDDEKPAHGGKTTVRERRDHLSGVIHDLDPDIVVVVEGPNRASELALFFDTDVTGSWVVQNQYSKGQSQNVGIAVRTDTGKFEADPFDFYDTNNIEAFDPFLVDTDSDNIDEQHKFERRPLYVQVRPKNGRNFRIMGLHLKSKGIFNSYEWSKWWQMADANRRKLLAQATRIRLEFLNPYLTDSETKNIPLIVCGDINDGPGLDASEKRLFGSAVERLMGTVWDSDRCLGNALFDTLSERDKKNLSFEKIYTVSYRDPIFNNAWQRVWIDHVLYSRNFETEWVTNAQIHRVMPDGKAVWQKYPHASDHYPLTVTVNTAVSAPPDPAPFEPRITPV